MTEFNTKLNASLNTFIVKLTELNDAIELQTFIVNLRIIYDSNINENNVIDFIKNNNLDILRLAPNQIREKFPKNLLIDVDNGVYFNTD